MGLFNFFRRKNKTVELPWQAFPLKSSEDPLVQKWAVPLGTARGFMIMWVKGIVYNVITDGNRTSFSSDPQTLRTLRINQEALENAAMTAANAEILLTIGLAMGKTGDRPDLGSEFDHFQELAFDAAAKALMEIPSPNGRNWIDFMALQMDLWAASGGSPDRNKSLWDGIRGVVYLTDVSLASLGISSDEVWEVARQAVESATLVAIRTARQTAKSVGIINDWGSFTDKVS